MPLGKSKQGPSAADAEQMEEVRQAAVRGDSDTVVRLMGEGVKLEPDEVRHISFKQSLALNYRENVEVFLAHLSLTNLGSPHYSTTTYFLENLSF